ASGANIFVNWKALEAAGVDRNAPVSARLRNIKFSKALTIILDSVSGGTVQLGFTTEDGVVTVSTRDDLEKDVVTEVYDVRDLIVPIPDYDPPPAHDVKPNATDPAAKSAGPGDDAAGRGRQEAIDRLTKLIRESVEPPAWEKTARLRE